MKKSLILSFLGLALLCQGCTTMAAVARTTIVQPAHFCDSWDRLWTHCLHQRLAREALGCYASLHPGQKLSSDFEKGFIAGYTRFLDKGGTGNPPPLPPRHYWRVKYRTVEGRAAVEDWFAGFREGSSAAMASGIRQVDTVATSVPPLPSVVAGTAFSSESGSGTLPFPRQATTPP